MSGRDYDPRAGHSNGESAEMPADLAAVQADDALLDMLGNPSRTPDEVDGELARVLTAWRREVQADSNRLLVDTETALSVISAARRPARRGSPIFGPIAAAAAVLVIAFSAVGLVAKSAQPGDSLWGVTQVLYSDYARSVEAAALVRTELDEARTALRQGKTEQAKASLDRIQQQLPVIAETEGLTDLTARHDELERELDAGPPVQGPASESPNAGSPEKSMAPLGPESSTTTRPDVDSSTRPEPDSSARPEPDSSTRPDPDSATVPDSDSATAPGPDSSTSPAVPNPNPSTEPTAPSRPDEPHTQPRTKPSPPPPPDIVTPEPPSSPPPPQPTPSPSVNRPQPPPQDRGSR